MNINTLVPDIYKLVEAKDGWFNTETVREFGEDISLRLHSQLSAPARKPGLRLSQMGQRCPCALWHSVHHPELAEPLPPWAEVKFAFGHIIEALAIGLAKASGHRVEGEQDELVLDGIKGHRDCVIDGCLVDVKSSSTRGFQKFKDRTLQQNDSFGYLDQLDGYLCASMDDPLVRVKDKAYILAIDKTLGHMVLYVHELREERIKRTIANYKAIVAGHTAPSCTCGTVAEGKSGNIKLDMQASYSAYKHCCFPQLRTFIYSSGPIYLTHVARTPDVPEIYRSSQRHTLH